MTISNIFVQMLGANDEQLHQIVQSMSESQAKQILEIIMKKMNDDRRESTEL